MSDEQYTLAGRALCARFVRAADRYAHAIWLRKDNREELLLESVEGTPADAWPPSPPLQSLTVQEPSPGRSVAMLLGVAGQSHWSVAAELVASAEGEWLVFDFACRADRAPDFLGCRYRLGPAARWEAHTSLVTFPLANARLLVDAHTAIVPLASSPSEVEVIPRLVSRSAPAIRGDIKFPATIRWKYSVEVLAAVDGP